MIANYDSSIPLQHSMAKSKQGNLNELSVFSFFFHWKERSRWTL